MEPDKNFRTVNQREISVAHRIPDCPKERLISVAECRGCEYNDDVEHDYIYCTYNAKDHKTSDKEPEMGISFDIAPDGDGRNRIYVLLYDSGTFSIEVSKEELEKLHMQLTRFLNLSQKGDNQ